MSKKLESKVSAIQSELDRVAFATGRESTSFVTHYGAYDVHPKYLVFWICVKTDAERDRLASDRDLMRRLREVLVRHDYPVEGRDHVQIGFESEETVDRVAGGDWYQYWK